MNHGSVVQDSHIGQKDTAGEEETEEMVEVGEEHQEHQEQQGSEGTQMSRYNGSWLDST